MLETIRTAAQTWVAKVILALISIPFALWGVESYVRTTPGQDSVATVGSEKITNDEFQRAVTRQLDQFKEQFKGQIDASIMDNPEMRKGILDQLVDQRLLGAAAKSAGLRVSDETLRERIANEPSFQENGKFSSVRYEIFLKSQGQSAMRFEELFRRDIERQKLYASVNDTAITSSTSVKQFLRASEQTREVAVVNLAPEQFLAAVTITPERAKAHYEEKKADFAIPEQVRAEYLELSVDALAPQIDVSADELKAYYDTNSVRFVQKEQRRASHILISAAATASDAEKNTAREKADALALQVRAKPADFADVAKKNSQDPGSAANGGDLDFFARGAMVKPFEEAVFTGKTGDIVGPVKSDFGYHIIRITDVRAEKGKSIAEVKPEIEGEIKKQKAQKKYAELAEQFSNLVYEKSGTLKDASDATKLTIRQSAWISKGQQAPAPFSNKKLITALFSDDVVKNKRNTEAVEVAASTLIAARVLESKPSSVRPFADVEAGIIAKLKREDAVKLAKADGDAKLALLKDGKAADVKWPAPLAVSRANAGGLQQPIIDAVMKANTQTLPLTLGVELPGAGYSLVQVTKVIDPADGDDAKIKATKGRIAQASAQQDLQSLLALAKAKVGVEIVKSAIEKKADVKP